MGGGSSVPLRDAERIDRERARELADDAWSEDCFDRLCGADGRITADQLHTLAIALAPLSVYAGESPACARCTGRSPHAGPAGHVRCVQSSALLAASTRSDAAPKPS